MIDAPLWSIEIMADRVHIQKYRLGNDWNVETQVYLISWLELKQQQPMSPALLL